MIMESPCSTYGKIEGNPETISFHLLLLICGYSTKLYSLRIPANKEKTRMKMSHAKAPRRKSLFIRQS